MSRGRMWGDGCPQFSSSTLFIKISELVKYTTSSSSSSVFLETNRRNREASTPHRVERWCICYSWKVHTPRLAAAVALQCVATRTALFSIALSSHCQCKDRGLCVCYANFLVMFVCIYMFVCVLVRPVKHAALVSDTLGVSLIWTK